MLTLTQVDSIVDAALDNPSAGTGGVDPMMLSEAVRTGLIAGIVIDLVIAALWIFLALRVRAGKTWAKIVLTVITVIGCVSMAFNLDSAFGSSGFGTVLGVLQVCTYLLALAGVVCMYTPDTRGHFGR